jgi:hypothetical protein
MIAQCSRDFRAGSGYDASMPNPQGDRSKSTEIPVLLPRRAFLVECSSSEAVSDEQLSGRVEHIVSGRATSFESASKLIDFILGVLAPGQVGTAARDGSPDRHERGETK